MAAKDEGEFKLHGTDNIFKQKSNDIFGCLDVIEAKHTAVQKAQKNDDVVKDDIPLDDHHIPKKRSLPDKEYGSEKFKKPRIPYPRGKKIPDHKANPQNYTFYNLSDVDNSKMSDSSNRSAALSFLNDLRKNKNQLQEQEEKVTLSEKIVFKKPSSSEGMETETSEPNKSHVLGGKVIMPEYSIGSKKSIRKSKEASNKQGNNSNNIKLGHLEEDGAEKQEEDVVFECSKTSDELFSEASNLVSQETSSSSGAPTFKKKNLTNRKIRNKEAD
jgi:hypothetical protein